MWTALALLAAVLFLRAYKIERQKTYAPASKQQKGILLVLGAAMVASWSITELGWHPFNGFERQITVIIVMIGIIYVLRLTDSLRLS